MYACMYACMCMCVLYTFVYVSCTYTYVYVSCTYTFVYVSCTCTMRLKGCLGNPAISQLRQDAKSATVSAQEVRGAERTRLLDVAMDLRKRKLDAW